MSNSIASVTTTSPTGEQEECAKIIIDTPANPFKLSSVMSEDGYYTVSFYAKSASSGSISIGGTARATTTSWAKKVFTFDNNGNSSLYMDFISGTYYLYHVKLERGKVATDWNITPGEQATTAEIQILDGEISSKVSVGEVISCINQTAETIKIQADKIELDGSIVIANESGDKKVVTIKDGSITADKIAAGSITVGTSNLVKGTATMTVGGGSWGKGTFYQGGSGSAETVTVSDSPIGGITSGVKITATSTTANCWIAQSGRALTSGYITESVWVKGVSGDTVIVRPASYGDLTSGQKSFTLNGSWQRLSYTGELASDSTYNIGYVILKPATAGNTATAVGLMVAYGSCDSSWCMADEDKVSGSDIYTAGTTTIDGGNITTGTITADQIASKTITADEIDIDKLFAEDVTVTGKFDFNNDSYKITTSDSGVIISSSADTSLTAVPTVAIDKNSVSISGDAINIATGFSESVGGYGALTLTGNIKLSSAPTIGKHASAVGTIILKTATTTNISSSTITSIASVTLGAGVWLVTAQMQFPSDANGRRSICINDTYGKWAYDKASVGTTAISGAVTCLNCSYISSSSANVTLYMNAYQNSGSAMNLTASYCFLQAVRII